MGLIWWLLSVILFNAVFFMLSLTATLQRSWPIEYRQFCMVSNILLLKDNIFVLTVRLTNLSYYLMQNFTTLLVEGYLIRTYHQNQELIEAPTTNAIIRFSIRLVILFPAFITNLLIVGNWLRFLQALIGQLTMACLVHSLKLSLYEQVHPAMPEFSSFSLIYSMFLIMALYTCIFAILEKFQKERFVINQTNQQTRKLFCEVINSGCAQVIVTPDGKITFFN